MADESNMDETRTYNWPQSVALIVTISLVLIGGTIVFHDSKLFKILEAAIGAVALVLDVLLSILLGLGAVSWIGRRLTPLGIVIVGTTLSIALFGIILLLNWWLRA